MIAKIYKLTMLLLIAFLMLVQSPGCMMASKTANELVSFNLGHEPEIIDPALCTTIEEGDVILSCFEGLMMLDKDNRAIPGVAESFTRDSDVKYTFKLRSSKWCDGKPVTARDFEYGWKRALSPEIGGESAYQLYCIKNGEAYNKKMTEAESVGINVIDENTLEVTLESPVPYFLEMLALPVYMPVREDVIKSNPDKWYSIPSTFIGNGPFKLTSWRAKEAMELVKNTNYYDSKRVRLNRIIFSMIEDPNTDLAAWESGDIDCVEMPPFSELPRLKSQSCLRVSPYLGIYYYSFNNSNKPFNDKMVRKALTYAIDRMDIVQNITKDESFPANALVPYGILDADISRDFRDIGGDFIKSESMIEEAKSLLAKAGYPEGKDFPKVTLFYNDTYFHSNVAMAIQKMWKNNLNIDINLQSEGWKSLQRLKVDGNYQIARSGWIADCIDPVSFLDIFVTGGGNNESRYSNKLYDDLMGSVKMETDPQKRFKYLHDAESILMEDMPVLPIFYYSNCMLIKDNIKGINESPLGFTYFDRGYVDGNR